MNQHALGFTPIPISKKNINLDSLGINQDVLSMKHLAFGFTSTKMSKQNINLDVIGISLDILMIDLDVRGMK